MTYYDYIENLIQDGNIKDMIKNGLVSPKICEWTEIYKTYIQANKTNKGKSRQITLRKYKNLTDSNLSKIIVKMKEQVNLTQNNQKNEKNDTFSTQNGYFSISYADLWGGYNCLSISVLYHKLASFCLKSQKFFLQNEDFFLILLLFGLVPLNIYISSKYSDFRKHKNGTL